MADMAAKLGSETKKGEGARCICSHLRMGINDFFVDK